MLIYNKFSFTDNIISRMKYFLPEKGNKKGQYSIHLPSFINLSFKFKLFAEE